MSLANLRRVYDLAVPSERAIALESYRKYHRILSRMGERHGYTIRAAAGVFAALSPNNDYHGNLKDANRLMANACAGNTIDSFKVHTYTHNKIKAWNVAAGADPLAIIIADKTRNFYRSIVNPEDPDPCCIDGHMFCAYANQRRSLVGLRVPSGAYAVVASAVRQLAQEKGVITSQMQGIIWLTWKRIHRIRISPQMEFWDPDWLAADFGFVPA